MNAIRTEKLTKYYGNARGIIDVCLSVNEGEFHGFIGPNGAGKSTAIRTLLGLISPTSGQTEILGKDIRKQKHEILCDIGYLPSETVFYSGMSVGDIIALSAKLRKKDCREEAAKLCRRFDLDTSKKIDELSLGNRKKVGIVCAMQHKPKLYIMDEPTSGLDPLMQHEFYDVLKERNEEGATIFLSSHILSEIQQYCKYATFIRDGKILKSEKIENLGYTEMKNITLKGIRVLPSSKYIRNIKTEHDTVRFLYSGSTRELLTLLQQLQPQDLTISEPSLEEIFLHFYTEEEL